MRGDDLQQFQVFSYVTPEERVPTDHPLRAIRKTVDEVLRSMSRQFDKLYAETGRKSIPPGTVAGAVAADLLLGAQRADVDGATALQPVVPLVRGAGDG